MNERETKFFEYMALLGEIFDRKISQVLIEAYFKALKDIPSDLVFQAFEHAIAHCRFFPKPAELRQLALGKDEDSALLAWVIVEKAIRHVGAYDSVRFNDPIIHSAIEGMGGWVKLCETPETELKWKAKEFQTLYRAMKGKRVHPEYLPGIVERDNAAFGFVDDIPEPTAIEEQLVKKLEGAEAGLEDYESNVRILQRIQNNSGSKAANVSEGQAASA